MKTGVHLFMVFDPVNLLLGVAPLLLDTNYLYGNDLIRSTTNIAEAIFLRFCGGGRWFFILFCLDMSIM